MKYTVYVLYSSTCGKHYTGYTSDLPNRLLSHNHLGKDWTARYRPWALIYSEEFITQQEAMTYEKWLKTGAGRDFVKKIAHWCLDSYPPRRTGAVTAVVVSTPHAATEAPYTFCFLLYSVNITLATRQIYPIACYRTITLEKTGQSYTVPWVLIYNGAVAFSL